jgi:O-antigen ligase
MNRSGVYSNGSSTDSGQYYRLSQPSFMDAPVISISTQLSLLGYLLSLALTQTTYGGPFMAIRWLTLGALGASCIADWILFGTRWGFRSRGHNGLVMMTYLLMTFGTVIYAENWLFSGIRWASHALMLVVFVLIMPQLLSSRQTKILLAVLKCLMAALVVVSWVFPAPPTVESDDSLYQGVMGNANTMGHIAFIAALLFIQDFILSDTTRKRCISGIIAGVSMITVWQSGARSSMIALTIGILMLFYYYRKEMRTMVMVGILLGSMAMVSFPKLAQSLFRFAQKSDQTVISSTLDPMKSRIPVWSAAYEGFKKRPLLGWGFGADSNISKQWEIRMTSIGTVERDPVNDFLFMMEGGGIIGLAAYILLVFIVLKPRPSKFQYALLQGFIVDPAGSHGDMALHHAHVIFYILPVCLIVLNQFDNSALSAGNLISVVLWISTGCAAALHHEIS